MTEFYYETLGEINGKTLMDWQLQFDWYQGKWVRKIARTNYRISAGHFYDGQFNFKYLRGNIDGTKLG